MDNSNRVRRNKAAKLVNDIFSTYLEDTAAECFDEQTRALTAVDRTGNIGAYLPAITDVVCGQLRRSIGNLAKAYATEFTGFGIPCDPETEIDLEHNARLLAGSASGTIRGRLELLERRTKKHLNIPAGLGHIQRRVAGSTNIAVKKGKIRLRRQRIALDAPLNISVSQSQKNPRSQCQLKEVVMRVFPHQEFPKSMHHAIKAPVIVYSRREQAELGPEWSETYIYQPYPKMKYHWDKESVTVKNAEEEAALGEGWADNPAAFDWTPGNRTMLQREPDPLKWADEWTVPGLCALDRNRIKGQLLKAHATFLRLSSGDQVKEKIPRELADYVGLRPVNPFAHVECMQQAFRGIAEVLYHSGILTRDLLQNEIRMLVSDTSIAAGWWPRPVSECRTDLYTESLATIGSGPAMVNQRLWIRFSVRRQLNGWVFSWKLLLQNKRHQPRTESLTAPLFRKSEKHNRPRQESLRKPAR